MSRIPDAWDDDYEALADTKGAERSRLSSQARTSRADRKAQHQEANKQLWNSAENPETFHFVESQNGGVSLPNATLKPALKVLSRKPVKLDTVSNGATADLANDDDIDSEEEERREQERALKDRQEKAALERAEKQRKYAEVRERLFGSTTPSTEAASGRQSPSRRSEGRPRGRGGMRSGNASAHTSSNEQSPARPNSQRKLYDPNDTNGLAPRPFQKAAAAAAKDSPAKPTREPKGPDGSGRGGFAPRGKSG